MIQDSSKINCPHCTEEIDLFDDDNFQDEFCREETTFYNCPFCEKCIEIKPEAIWSFKVKIPEDV